jgi:hypothetical protein
MFNSKNKINPMRLQTIFFDTKIPGGDLKDMQNIIRDVWIFNIFIHDVTKRDHLEIAFSIFSHVAFGL